MLSAMDWGVGWQVEKLQGRVEQMERKDAQRVLQSAVESTLGEEDTDAVCEDEKGRCGGDESGAALESLQSEVAEGVERHKAREAELIEEIESLKGEVEREMELSCAASDTAETEWLRRSAAERDLQSVKRELEQAYVQVQQMHSIQESPSKNMGEELAEQAALTEEFRSQLDQTVECLQEAKEENVCLRRLSFLPDTDHKEVVLKERILELERVAEQRQAEVRLLSATAVEEEEKEGSEG